MTKIVKLYDINKVGTKYYNKQKIVMTCSIIL